MHAIKVITTWETFTVSTIVSAFDVVMSQACINEQNNYGLADSFILFFSLFFFGTSKKVFAFPPNCGKLMPKTKTSRQNQSTESLLRKWQKLSGFSFEEG